jgi:hypothetical protein
MKCMGRSIALGVICLAALVQAGAPLAAGLGANGTTNPYNSPIRQINPNSRQGTAPLTPQSPTQRQLANPRPPTLQNGGIGNGQNIRPAPTPVITDPVRPPRPATTP